MASLLDGKTQHGDILQLVGETIVRCAAVRIFLERDQLHKKLGWSFEERLADYEAHPDLLKGRDDLYIRPGRQFPKPYRLLPLLLVVIQVSQVIRRFCMASLLDGTSRSAWRATKMGRNGRR